MAVIDQIEYSVCEDCLAFVANGDLPEDGNDLESAFQDEKGLRKGHWVAGVTPTEDDPEGHGYDAFSWQACEVCCAKAGSRNGITLLLEDDS